MPWVLRFCCFNICQTREWDRVEMEERKVNKAMKHDQDERMKGKIFIALHCYLLLLLSFDLNMRIKVNEQNKQWTEITKKTKSERKTTTIIAEVEIYKERGGEWNCCCASHCHFYYYFWPCSPVTETTFFLYISVFDSYSHCSHFICDFIYSFSYSSSFSPS